MRKIIGLAVLATALSTPAALAGQSNWYQSCVHAPAGPVSGLVHSCAPIWALNVNAYIEDPWSFFWF